MDDNREYDVQEKWRKKEEAKEWRKKEEAKKKK